MYCLNFPIAQLRTKLRQEFERHRYVNKLPVVDMLLFQSRAEFQVRRNTFSISARAFEPCDRVASVKEGEADQRPRTGDLELLETSFTCHEILQGDRKSRRKATAKFHAELLRGTLCCRKELSLQTDRMYLKGPELVVFVYV